MSKSEANTCPTCGKPLLTKAEMAVRILKKCGTKTEKSIYNDGTFTRSELAVVYKYIMKGE